MHCLTVAAVEFLDALYARDGRPNPMKSFSDSRYPRGAVGAEEPEKT